MKKVPIIAIILALLAMSASWAGAATLFEAFLTGLNSVPPNASPAIGSGTVLLNDAKDASTNKGITLCAGVAL